MDSIVLQLQRDALAATVPVSDLLRTASVVARKLGQAAMQRWITTELGGYADGTTIPEYRRLSGELRAQNPFHGLVPIMLMDEKVKRLASQRLCNQSIPVLENLVEGERGLVIPVPDEVAEQLIEGLPAPVYIVVQRSALVGILHHVRDTVLQWALQLEKDRILGEGISFTRQERAAAASTTYNTNFYGNVQQPQLAQGSPGTVQVMNATVSMEAVTRFAAMLREHQADLQLDNERSAELEAEISTLESQAKSPKPKQAIVRESLSSVRRILESAAGTAAGVLLQELASVLV